jgi:hypothetical protein
MVPATIDPWPELGAWGGFQRNVWSLAEVVTALQAMRGLDLVAAVTVLAEIGGASTHPAAISSSRETNPDKDVISKWYFHYKIRLRAGRVAVILALSAWSAEIGR